MHSIYYFFNPFSKQYYFPKGFKKYDLFLSFYQPYSFKGKVLWYFWLKFGIFRKICLEKNPNKILPILSLQNYIPSKSILAFNRGTIGPEQKTTILGIDLETNKEFFIKYGITKLARENVNNEGLILKQIGHLNFVPKLLNHQDNKEFTFIKTNILKGKRYTSYSLDKFILEILKTISVQNIQVTNTYNRNLKFSFAHGDFCPWNIMDSNSELKVFDWELAGLYPCGYDLFTFIFQTAALLRPNVEVGKIHIEYKKEIKIIFSFLGISNYKDYFIAFAELKLVSETKKNNHILIPYYKKLKDYAKAL